MGGRGCLKRSSYARRPNTDAIAQMAIENYLEMRSAVLDPEYRRRKQEEDERAKTDPNFISRYAKVMFHPEIGYKEISEEINVDAKHGSATRSYAPLFSIPKNEMDSRGTFDVNSSCLNCSGNVCSPL